MITPLFALSMLLLPAKAHAGTLQPAMGPAQTQLEVTSEDNDGDRHFDGDDDSDGRRHHHRREDDGVDGRSDHRKRSPDGEPYLRPRQPSTQISDTPSPPTSHSTNSDPSGPHDLNNAIGGGMVGLGSGMLLGFMMGGLPGALVGGLLGGLLGGAAGYFLKF